MNIKDVIVEELKAKIREYLDDVIFDGSVETATKELLEIVYPIISKLPKEEVIAEGKLENIGISPNGVVYTIFKNLKWPHKDISNIIGKNIRLKIEVIE